MKIDKLIIGISSFCNADCEFCVRKYDNTINNNINLDNLKSFLLNINLDKSIKIKLSGNNGDPLLYDKLDELLNFLFSNFENKIYLTTNGEINTDILKKYKNLIVTFSIDSILEYDIYRKIDSKQCIKNMIELSKYMATIRCKLILFKYNIIYIKKLKQICLANNIEFITMSSRTYAKIGPLSKPNVNLKEDRTSFNNYNECQLNFELSIQIDSRGFITPCCMVTPNFIFDKNIKDIKDIKDLEKYVSFYYKKIHPNCIKCKY